jgi:hypothetical protein
MVPLLAGEGSEAWIRAVLSSLGKDCVFLKHPYRSNSCQNLIPKRNPS